MKASLLLLSVCVAGPARAHYLWATLDPQAKTVAVALQEIPGDAPLPLGARVPRVQARSSGGVPLPLRGDGPWLRASTDAKAVGASLDYGVVDRHDVGRGVFWLQYSAKAATTVEASRQTVGLPVEMSIHPASDGIMVVTVTADGKPFKGAEVTIEVSSGDKVLDNGGKTDEFGTVRMRQTSGPLAVRALVTSMVKGTHEGQAYDLVRSYGTLTIANPGQATEAKPVSRQMREAFGHNHDVVSHSAFIETVMAGKLTRAQLIDHLRQREIVNAAVDDALKDAPGVPYGPEQRNVLTLLRANLAELGAGETTEAQAWPLTQSFVAEIRKGGPFFALGVFHVYYGGVTNGGRDIGAMIEEQTKFTPTYYLKSDGYPAYLKRLDATVTDPEAQKAAVQGGLAAYRYIIAINDAAPFKS